MGTTRGDSLCRREQRNAAWGLGGPWHQAASVHQDSVSVWDQSHVVGCRAPPDRYNNNVSRWCSVSPGDRRGDPLGRGPCVTQGWVRVHFCSSSGCRPRGIYLKAGLGAGGRSGGVSCKGGGGGTIVACWEGVASTRPPQGGDLSLGRGRRGLSATLLGDHLSPESRTYTSPTGAQVTPSPTGTQATPSPMGTQATPFSSPIHHSQCWGLQVPPPAPPCSAPLKPGRLGVGGLPVWG